MRASLIILLAATAAFPFDGRSFQPPCALLLDADPKRFQFTLHLLESLARSLSPTATAAITMRAAFVGVSTHPYLLKAFSSPYEE